MPSSPIFHAGSIGGSLFGSTAVLADDWHRQGCGILVTELCAFVPVDPNKDAITNCLHLRRPAMTAIPILQIRRAEGEDWWVAATWPDGHFEEIAGFKNETDANDWITKKFQAWLEDREKKDSIA
jgi:hypothetical protein